MLKRVLEPEVMDTEEDAMEYNSIANDEVNKLFIEEVIASASDIAKTIVDLGTGPAHIPILLAQKNPDYEITGVELAESMITIAKQNINNAGMAKKIKLIKEDIKSTTLENSSFDIVISNSCIHHIHNPIELLSEAKRLVSRGGVIYFKDLLRPQTLEELEAIVVRYASNDTDYQRELFYNSLHAALTLDELNRLSQEAGLLGAKIRQTSDRHWVLIYQN